MDKLKMETPDMAAENIEKIGALFPSVVTEMRGEDGSIKKGVDFEMLKQLLSPDVVEEGDERYEFTWVGKKQAVAEAARPTTKTLRPVKEDSRNWDTTENLYIEGDNLEVLKILQESYLGKIKMIYIDPPYNTGNDFIYPDSFSMENDEYNNETEYFDEDGRINYKRKNTASGGKYHSNWCSMMYSRLLIARNLLSDDGLIMISIDEHEQGNLREICDEVFGTQNFVECLVYDKKAAPKGVPPVNMIVGVHEYIFCYAKNTSNFSFIGMERSSDGFSNPDHDSRGLWRNTNIKSTTSENAYEITDPLTGQKYTDTWAFAPDELNRMITEGRIIFPKNPNGQVRAKEYFSEFSNKYIPIKSSLGLYDAQWNTEMLTSLMGGKYFQNPKHLHLMEYIIRATMDKTSIILDFFSGSATTAHAVMRLNAEDGGHRKFIMVQLPEPCDEKSEAFKAGYKNICEIGKERIRRAGDKIKAEHPDADPDIGFRVFRVDESNMKNVYYHPEEVTQLMLGETVSNIKEDRTDLDLLYACLLDWGVEINLPHTSTQVAGCTVHNVDNGALAACFDKAVPRAVVEYMANLQPLRAVFRDSAFATDAEKINVTEIFKNLSPDTKVKVI